MALIFLGTAAFAQPKHGIAMYGEPALPADYLSLPYANPDAPKGGRIVIGNNGGFDSLNPYIRKGSVPWQLRFFASESLMGRSRDEPFALYGLLAETIETGPNREWVEFTLRPEAKFWDGTPVTVEDVLWSYETLGTVGHPRYHGFWKKIDTIEQTGDRAIRITFNVKDRELALIAGLRPILKKAQFDGKDINDISLQEVPMTTSPYMVTDFEANRYVTLTRNPDYWGKDLPFRRGTHNFDELRIEFFGDAGVLFEGFKAGEISFMREFNAEKWASNYDFPRRLSGDVIQTEFKHKKPSGMTGLVMNSRRPYLNDIRVRDALMHAFNFEFINNTITGGRQPRITSYFSNSVLGMDHNAAAGRVAEFLVPYADILPMGAIQGYALPVSDGTARNRDNIGKATHLLQDAGFKIVDGVMMTPEGSPFALDVLMRQGDSETQTVLNIYKEDIKRLGIALNIVVADGPQFTQRTNTFDFDLSWFRRAVSLSPGNEQNLYWGSAAADQEGARNWMGVKSPAIDGLINAMLTSESQTDFVAATKALDRTLTAGRHVIPFWNYAVGRIAHIKEMRYPEYTPIYGEGYWMTPEIWWYEED
ncbi:MAG: extracellular solute-binding protein [Cognatishimia sp.]